MVTGSAVGEYRTVRVAAVIPQAEDIVSLILTSADGSPLPEWTGGAHIDMLLKEGLERQYSLCGSPDDRAHWRISVLRDPHSRGGSAWIHSEIHVGDRVKVRGPRNNFPLISAQEYLFIAGGIGITPFLPMISALESAGQSWRLVYGGRRISSMAFVDELSAYGDKVLLWPQDGRGLIDLESLLASPRRDVALYACGPEALLGAVEERSAHWPSDALHLERFRPRAGALEGVNSSFEVVLDTSGLSITVEPTQTIVDAVLEAGVHVPTSCREGTCGTCETFVLEGIPDHRDSYLTPQERETNEVMMVCCSRAKTARLVLDL